MIVPDFQVVSYLMMLASFFHCLIYFDSRVKEFRNQKQRLTLAKAQLQKDIGDAKAQKRGIKDGVETWLEEAEQVLKAVRTLEDNIRDHNWRLTSRLNWSQRFHLSNEIEQQEQKIIRLVWNSHYDRVVFPAATLWENELLPSSYSMPSQSLKSALTEIVNAMRDGTESVLIVCGQRGVGKTTLARAVGKIANEFLHLKVVRLAVSQATTTEEVQDTLAAFLKLEFPKNTKKERAKRLRRRLRKEEKILIILDDFRKELNLESIGIPNQVGCKILLTTRDTQVCSSMEKRKEITLEALDNPEAWALLKKNLSQDMTPEVSQVAIRVAEECKHSPIAVITVGRALRGKVLDQWRNAYDRLKSNLAEDESEEVSIVHRSVKLSYDHLKYNETKKCFLLCSLFPKNSPIAPPDLIRYAWGLGIYQGIDSIEEVSEKVNGAIENLKDSFLLLEYGKAHVQMQNVVREAALWLASKEESFLRIKRVVGLWETPKNEDLESCAAISYVTSKPEEVLDEELRSEKLQILFLAGNGCKKISNEFLQHLKALKVLALHHGVLSPNALQNLTNLRALHLEYCKFDGLAPSLENLKELEILSFQGSDISELTDDIGKLDNLRLLDLFDCQKLHRIPLKLIQKLSGLEELYFSGLSFERWWSEEKISAEGSNPTPPEIVSPSSLPTQIFKYPKIDEWFDKKSRALKVSVFLQNQSNGWDENVQHLARDLILCYKNHIVPNLVQSVKKVRVICCNRLQAVFQDGSILHGVEDNSQALLSDLTSLELEELPKLSRIWYGQTNNVSLQNLCTVKLKDCQRLKYLFSTSIAQRLKQLETLEIHGCNMLKQIIAETSDDLNVDVNEIMHPALLHPLCLPRLTTLQITGCLALEYVFQITTGRILQKLTLLEISSCPQLAQVFSFQDAAEGEEIEVPQLKNLALKDLLNLKTFCSENRSIKLPSLKQFEVEACHQFSNDVMSEVIKHGRLEEFCLFKMGNQLCGEIFELPGGYILSSLKKLTLKEINELQVIWKEPTQIVTLQNLTRLELVRCNKLRTLFSLLHARNLLQLSHLVVQGCKDLEQIVARDQISSLSSSRLKPVYFPNLEEILIEDCNNLKSLFPVRVAHIPELRTLRVKRASRLKHIFRHEGEAKVKSEAEIVLRFPKLEVLHLGKLPDLVTIIPVGYECEFPALVSLEIKECTSQVTSFSNVDSEPIIVYAKTEETSLPERRNYPKLVRFATVKKLLTNIDGDIVWSPGMKIDRNKLSESSQPTGKNMTTVLFTTSSLQYYAIYCATPQQSLRLNDRWLIMLFMIS
ncbi:Cc-nbs-lrr resistance protein [Theobroma cacao]|uniref:Cc-nbs-lrr resistance protein n=1 Tax=Theobroma cacao TaxID=3641 RepID=A0A061F6B7_THECC|nr:Cc-nbs-lrr resistance protein [Theobroma cacao]